jgi:hypothetical protein
MLEFTVPMAFPDIHSVVESERVGWGIHFVDLFRKAKETIDSVTRDSLRCRL